MANYTIRTTRQQEVGLKFAYDHYADKGQYPTQVEYFQAQIDQKVSNPMYVDQQRAQLTTFDQSFNSIPEVDQPVARTEIESVITAHGGTIISTPGTVAPIPGFRYEPPPIPGFPPLEIKDAVTGEPED